MRTTQLAAAGFVCLALASLSTTAQSAPIGRPGASALQTAGLAQTVDYRNYCGRWRDICANRWGWRTWRYRRCLSVHGCL